jgi:hypothetical protein
MKCTLPKDPYRPEGLLHALLAREKEERTVEEDGRRVYAIMPRPNAPDCKGEKYKRLYESEMATLRQKVECICSNKYGIPDLEAWKIVENLPESTRDDKLTYRCICKTHMDKTAKVMEVCKMWVYKPERD